jgi:two-component system chemotaxis response regulator CheB
MKRTRVMIVDDSALMRQLLTNILSSERSIEVVGTAPDPIAAWHKMQSTRPDVLTLDVEMPKMDGLTFLEKLMSERPMPVVMVSSLTATGASTTLRALELGALDFITKPRVDLANGTLEQAEELISKVRTAGATRVRSRTGPAAPTPLLPVGSVLPELTHRVIALGASTGGTEALREVLTQLPPDCPGVVVVQHMPPVFTKHFAQRLDSLCRVLGKEAVDGDRVLPGQVLIAPGDFHMRLVREGASVSVRLSHEPAVNHHRPAVDVLFHSCAEHMGRHAVGALLTGMGADGAKGLLAMRRAGARTFAQDEATSVVFGMPKEAIACGAAESVLPLQAIAGALIGRS